MAKKTANTRVRQRLAEINLGIINELAEPVCAYCKKPFNPDESDADDPVRYCSTECDRDDNYSGPDDDGEAFRGGEAAAYERERMIDAQKLK